MPPWADAILVPLISLLIAFVISGLVIWAIGQNPFEALNIMVAGAVGSAYGWGYTLYYATNFMFTGLAVAVAFHASQFNIGGEGQATLGGLGVALALLFVPWPHWTIALLAAAVSAAAFGAAWAAIPAWLQARRGSHIVITTIMFNFIAYAVMNYALNKWLKPAGSMDPSSARFPEAARLPSFYDLPLLGGMFSKSAPANVTFFIALLCALGVWLLLWRTRLGYMIRAFGKSEPAINGTMGAQKRLILNAVEGAGFIGIAVSLMGRNHPLGIVLASILFGFLYQGGAELSLAINIPSQLVTVIQALVILFTGALDNMVRMPLEKAFLAGRRGTG
jgi:simple sugar transport system permease protein